MVKLIVNADDYGIDENRTTAILECFRQGMINQTTALVTMPYYEQAVDRIKSAGLIGRMGLHFNLTEGQALSDEMRACRFFCDEEGMFTASFHHRYYNRFLIPFSAARAVRAEAKAQGEKFLATKGVLMHLDSHHHVHTDYSIARILMPIAKQYGFFSVRRSRNMVRGYSLGMRVYKRVLNKMIPGGLGGARLFGAYDDLREWYSPGADFEAEVMVHPMYGSPQELFLDGPLTDSGRYFMSEQRDYYKSIGAGL